MKWSRLHSEFVNNLFVLTYTCNSRIAVYELNRIKRFAFLSNG
jgi:hypothetical protein